jgi:hypothetical protein
MLFDRPYTRDRAHFGSFNLVTLVWSHLRWEWQAIIPSSPVVTIVFYHAMEVSCYHSFWAVKSWLCLRLDTLGLWLVSASRYLVAVRRMSNLSALTFKSASQSCLRIHLDCLTAIKSNLFGPQDCLKRCRGGHQGDLIHLLGIPLAPTMWLYREPVISIVGSCGSILAPRKDDGTDFGCVWTQSNGLIALEIKCCCIRLEN